jgi:hypothetical protein
MKAYMGLEVQLHLFLTLHYVEVSGHFHDHAYFPPGKAPSVLFA